MQARVLPALVLLLSFSAASFGADVNTYALIKNRSYDQTNATTTVLSSGTPFQFIAVVDASLANVSSASFQSPPGTNYALTNVPGIGPFAFTRSFSNQTALDTQLPNGTYNFTINAVNDGTQSPGITITGNLYPAAPVVANFAAAQLIGPSTNFTVNWAPFATGTTDDNIVFNLRTQGGATVFSTPVFGQPGALNGTATSVVIPANTLSTGGVYTATLSFAKVAAVDPFQYFGVPGVSVYTTSTDLRMRALSVPFLTITITNSPAATAQLRFNSDPGRAYDIRASSNLTAWNSLSVTTATGNTVIYLDTNSPALTNRFYRLQDP